MGRKAGVLEGLGAGLGAGGGVSFFLGRNNSSSLSFSLWITLELSASLMQPLRGPREASSVSITLSLIFLAAALSSSSMWRDFRRSPSSSSSPLKNLDLNLLDLLVVSPSSSSPPYLPKLVLLLLASRL